MHSLGPQQRAGAKLLKRKLLAATLLLEDERSESAFFSYEDFGGRLSVLDCMRSAVETPHGVVIATPDREAFRKEFYRQREIARSGGITAFDNLTCSWSPDSTEEVWLIHKAPQPTISLESLDLELP